MRLAPLLICAVVAAGCARTPEQMTQAQQAMAADQAALQKSLAGLVPERPTTCLPNFRSLSVQAYGPTLVYSQSDTVKYRTDTSGGCESLARGDILVTQANSGRLCQGDIARTVAPIPASIPTGSCALGPFTRYAKP